MHKIDEQKQELINLLEEWRGIVDGAENEERDLLTSEKQRIAQIRTRRAELKPLIERQLEKEAEAMQRVRALAEAESSIP